MLPDLADRIIPPLHSLVHSYILYTYYHSTDRSSPHFRPDRITRAFLIEEATIVKRVLKAKAAASKK